MKMTVHQRLQAQRQAERWKAHIARHRREVAWDITDFDRCIECFRIPIHPRAEARMDDEDRARHEDGLRAFPFWVNYTIPDEQSSKAEHIRYALGYGAW